MKREVRGSLGWRKLKPNSQTTSSLVPAMEPWLLCDRWVQVRWYGVLSTESTAGEEFWLFLDTMRQVLVVRVVDRLVTYHRLQRITSVKYASSP